MDKEELKNRTKQFALRVVRLVEALPRGRTADVLGRQLLRSGTSVGANYRAACRAKSTADLDMSLRGRSSRSNPMALGDCFVPRSDIS